MTVWTRRPIEIANLFNPAFCAIVLRDSIRGYNSIANRSMPYSLVFLIPPIVLHEQTRLSLPRSTRTKLHSWLHNNPWVKVSFAERTRRLIPYTKEAIIFGVQREIIEFDHQGNLNHVPRKLSPSRWEADAEAEQCVKKAAFLGRWFAESGDPTTIYPLWGIRP